MADGRDYGYFWNDDGSGNRTYNANSFEYWLKKFFTTGVFAGDLQVTAGGSYTVNVATGYANVNGKVREFYETESFTVPSANSTYPRIDTIVVRRDDTNKIISLQYVTGTYSGRNPSATAPTRSGAIYELVLAEIYVGAGATEILQRDITDKRADKTVCGIVTGTVEEVDFSQFASQFNSYYNEFKSGKQADFETWFAGIQSVLDGDTAGKLYNLIQENKAKLDGVAAGADQIARNTAQIETAGTATNAHSVGEYVMISNALYKVTASVAKGDTWTIGTNVTAANIGSEIGSLKSDLANKLYPVGSIYMSVNATNPAELFGGTWEQIKDRFLLAAGNTYAAGSTGGEAQHTLTIDEMPTHSHKTGIQSIASGYIDGNSNAVVYFDPSGRSTANTGGNQPHNNMPPYLAVYMWKRTA